MCNDSLRSRWRTGCPRSRKYMKEVTIVCDGSSLGNGKGATRAAAVAVLGYRGYWRAFGEYLGNATNQQAEIAAAWIGLKSLSEPCKVRLLSDSRYVVQTMTGNFRKKTNLDWWEKLEKSAKKHEIKWEWVKGHAGHKVQEVADKMARTMAELGRVDEEILDEAVAEIGVIEI
ncbi:ribonuclease HI [soil metagenome]